jgi:hypothetical protein
VYTNDPEDVLLHTESDRRAQALFEAERDAKRVSIAAAAVPITPSRRSTRGRVPKSMAGDFIWSPRDEYVLALDERQQGMRGVGRVRAAAKRLRERNTLTSLI